MMDCVVCPPGDQRKELPAEAVSTTLLPVQNEVGPFALTVAVGNGFAVTLIMEEVAEQPFALVSTQA